MVKRQTVWLSTMMVLSLMLIGYYTLNNGGSTTAGTNSVATSVGTPDTSGSTTGNATTGSQAQSGNSTSSGASNSASSSTSSTDWFVKSRTQVDQEMTQSTDLYEKIMVSPKSTNSQVAQAQQDLEQVQAIQGGMQNARDAILGDGYSDVVIFPTIDSKTGNLTNVSVYVKASKLTTDKAVQIMNIVSQHMNVSLDHITVHEHA